MTKVLVAILTSGKLEYLKETYNSVENQKDVTFDYDTYIVVNTLDFDYYDQVKKEFPDAIVMQTQSNGKPGKGHNSLHTIFRNNSKFDFLIPLDGDDFLYPYAFNRLEIYMKYSPDVLALPFNDILVTEYPDNGLSYPLLDKCYVRFNNYVPGMKDLWLKTKKSPFDNNVNDVNVAGRIMLLSRKAMDLNLCYDENVKWYDDLHPFLQIFEASVLKPNYNIFMMIEYDIYLYNRLNDESATQKFQSNLELNSKTEEKLFRQSIYNKFLGIRNWDLSQLKFLKADPSQHFNIDDKIKFCINIIKDFNLKSIEIKKDNFETFKNHAKSINNKELLDLYTN